MLGNSGSWPTTSSPTTKSGPSFPSIISALAPRIPGPALFPLMNSNSNNDNLPRTPPPPSPSTPPVSGNKRPTEEASSPAFHSVAPPAPTGLLHDDKDYDRLASLLNTTKQRVMASLKNESSLAFFKVAELKQIIQFLKQRFRLNIKVSGNKSELIQRISQCIFNNPQDTESSGDEAPSSTAALTNNVSPAVIPSQTISSSAPTPSLSGSSPPPAKRPKIGHINFNSQNVWIMPPATNLNVFVNMGSPLIDQAFAQKQIPYHKVVKQIAVIPFGPKNTRVIDRTQTYRHSFSLDHQVLQEISQKGQRKLAVHIRFWSTTKQMDIACGYDSNLRCNHRAVDLSRNYKKIRSKHFANPLILPYPAEITSLVSHNNFVEFTSPKNISGAAVIQLVQEVTTEELLPSIPRTNAEYRKPAPPPGMADIEETKVVVSLRCPLGYFRIEHPAKGIHCNHLQCFDVKSYLEYCFQQRLWHCPVCSVALPYNELIIDEYFNTILNTMDAESMKATIHPDGTFKPYEPPKTQRVVGKAAKEENVLEINLDEERRNQELLNNGNNNNNNDSTEGTGQPIVLAPIRIERTSDDENDDDDDDEAADNDEEKEYNEFEEEIEDDEDEDDNDDDRKDNEDDDEDESSEAMSQWLLRSFAANSTAAANSNVPPPPSAVTTPMPTTTTNVLRTSSSSSGGTVRIVLPPSLRSPPPPPAAAAPSDDAWIIID